MTHIEPITLSPYIDRIARMELAQWTGEITEVVGLLVQSRGPSVPVGTVCEIRSFSSSRSVRAQVIGFRDGRVLLMPLDDIDGIQLGDRVVARGNDASVGVGPALLGRVLDGFGQPIDDGPPLDLPERYPIWRPAPGPLERTHITDSLVTGVRVLDSLITCGKGQRIGIFGGSGVGKSTLLGSMSRHNFADVTVIALVGERNREVREFIDRELGPEGLKRAVVVAATSDRPAPVRVNACAVSLAIAEYFRDQGADVLLVMDSVTRLAMAQREIGLAAGEPPSQKGYTPSVFNLLPKIFERAGKFQRGSITGFFTVLVEGDDFNEPICDAVRSILDGHIVLSRRLAALGHYPAIDPLESISRLASRLAEPAHKEAASRLRQALALYRQSEDLIQLGAYAAGSNPELDACLRENAGISQFLRQEPHESCSFEETIDRLASIATRLGGAPRAIATHA